MAIKITVGNSPLTVLIYTIEYICQALLLNIKTHRTTCMFLYLSGSRDSNPESLVPKTSMLAVTPHPDTKQ